MISGEMDMADRLVLEEAVEIVPLDVGDEVTPPTPGLSVGIGLGGTVQKNKLI